MSRPSFRIRAAMKLIASASLLCLAATAVAQDRPGSRTIEDFVPVTDEYLRNPSPNDWVMTRGNYEMWAYSELDQINRDNIDDLTLVWARSMGEGPNEATPIIYNGVMYLANAHDLVQAIDAVTGDLIWEYDRPRMTQNWAEGPLRNDRGSRKRGLAIYENMILTVAVDNTLLALDATNGQVIWETNRGGDGYVGHGSPPTVVDGVVITGSTCQNAPFGCYVSGHDVHTGEELWRNEVIPRPGEPGDETWGGTPYETRWCTGAWGYITYDSEAHLLNYGSTGICPASEAQRNAPGATMAGTNERWAVIPETGEVVWRRQILPRDNWDQECTFEMMLIETPVNPNPDAQAMLAVNPNVEGETRRTLTGMPCKTPVFWSLDAETGEFFYAKATWDQAQSLYASIDETGLATMNEEAILSVPGEEVFWCPTFTGGRNWPSGAYDPVRNIIIQPTRDQCDYTTARADREPTPELTYNTSNRFVVNPFKDNDFVGRLDAVDVETGETVWSWENRAANHSPLLATAGGLVFNGAEDRYFRAHDLDTGEVVWETRLATRVGGGSATFSVDGRQYIAVVAGSGLVSSAGITREVDFVTGGDAVYVFALRE